MRDISFIIFVLVILISNNAYANSLTGTIHTLHVNLKTNRAHIYLEGKPTFDGGGCQGYWTGNSLDDIKFRQFIWPLLMTAKSTKEQVRVAVDGCIGNYPIIKIIDFVPSQ